MINSMNITVTIAYQIPPLLLMNSLNSYNCEIYSPYYTIGCMAFNFYN